MIRDHVCGVRSGAEVSPAPDRSHASIQSDPGEELALVVVSSFVLSLGLVWVWVWVC